MKRRPFPRPNDFLIFGQRRKCAANWPANHHHNAGQSSLPDALNGDFSGSLRTFEVISNLIWKEWSSFDDKGRIYSTPCWDASTHSLLLFTQFFFPSRWAIWTIVSHIYGRSRCTYENYERFLEASIHCLWTVFLSDAEACCHIWTHGSVL